MPSFIPGPPPTTEEDPLSRAVIQNLVLEDRLPYRSLASSSSPSTSSSSYSSSSSTPLEMAVRKPMPSSRETRTAVPPTRFYLPPAITAPGMLEERETAFRDMLAWTFEVGNARTSRVVVPSLGPRDEEVLVEDGELDEEQEIMGVGFQNDVVEEEHDEVCEGGSFEHVEHVEVNEGVNEGSSVEYIEHAERAEDVVYVEHVEDVGTGLHAEARRALGSR